MRISNSSEEVVWAMARPVTSAIEPRGAFPGVLGGKDCVSVLWGTRGAKVGSGGLWYIADVRKMLRGVDEVPEKLLVLYALMGGGWDMVDEEYADAEALYGLSPGFLLGRKADVVDDGIMLGAADEARSKSATLTLCESLLEGPWGRLRILRDASCVSEARLAGLSRTDALPESTRGGSNDTPEGFADDVVVVPLVSAGGAVLLRQRPRPEKPKRLLFLAGDSMLAMGGEEGGMARREEAGRKAAYYNGEGLRMGTTRRDDRQGVEVALFLCRRRVSRRGSGLGRAILAGVRREWAALRANRKPVEVFW